jgi:alpha-tubulin suppressor-like RCC1 family protein
LKIGGEKNSPLLLLQKGRDTTMELTIKERIIILGLLPRETNFSTLKVVRDVENEIGFSETDLKTFEIVTEGDSIKWNAALEAAMSPKDCKMGDRAYEIIKQAIKKLDDSNMLTKDHFSLYEKFVQEK